jgi:hypothetical protein
VVKKEAAPRKAPAVPAAPNPHKYWSIFYKQNPVANGHPGYYGLWNCDNGGEQAAQAAVASLRRSNPNAIIYVLETVEYSMPKPIPVETVTLDRTIVA